jgi:tRNA dimethylallyltransferase
MKALLIVGPTAVGKTALSFEISKKIPSVLISADSVQVFRGTDIISGKDIPKNAKFVRDHYVIGSVPLYLVDTVSPTGYFSVYDFINETARVISLANAEHKIPIIVGGTRFYIEALTEKIETLSIPPDQELRDNLNKLPVSKLQGKFKKINKNRFDRMNNSDRNNPRRLIRAIEVSLSEKLKTGKPLFKKDELLTIGLSVDFETLKKRISKRLSARINSGAFEEAKKLFENYNKLSDQIKHTNGYEQMFEYFKGRVSRNEVIKQWEISEHQLAREQMKWLATRQNIHLFHITKKGFKRDVMKLIEQNFTS